MSKDDRLVMIVTALVGLLMLALRLYAPRCHAALLFIGSILGLIWILAQLAEEKL